MKLTKKNYPRYKNIFILFFKLTNFLTRRRKFQLFYLLCLLIFSGFAEILSLAATIPFLKVLTDPTPLFKLSLIKKFIEINPNTSLVLPITIIFVFSIMFSAFIRIYCLHASTKLAAIIGSDLSSIIYRKTFYQTYNSFLDKNTSEVISLATTQIDHTAQALNMFMQLLTGLVISTFIVITICSINFRLAINLIVIFAIVYIGISFFVKKRLLKNSSIVVENNKKQIKFIQEGLSSIREIILGGYQNYYLNALNLSDRKLRIMRSESIFLSYAPRFFIEAIGFSLIALIAFFVSNFGSSDLGLIPLLGTLALGAQKLLPALQQIYSNWAGIRSLYSSIDNVILVLDENIEYSSNQIRDFSYRGLKNEIVLRNIYFKYNGAVSNTLKDINLHIKKGESIGIIGTTGDGKSTLLDIIMGLSKPSRGQLIIDGINIHSKRESGDLTLWRKSIGHVPQNINLLDLSIAENIAFGENKSYIDMNRVKEAANLAKIDSFIESLPNKYNEHIGELGKRISGGQRQRIGIARALYNQKEILILDEATSALDKVTEKKVIDSITKTFSSITIIMVAHKLSTLINVDKIIEIEKGRIKKIINSKT